MNTGLTELLPEDLDIAVERLLAPRLAALIAARQPGHCMRVDDLPARLAERLCRRLRGSDTPGEVCVLAGAGQPAGGVLVSSTKLVELRNPTGDGSQRRPLLVFVPPGARAAAEDSFGVATFEEVSLGDVYRDLANQVEPALPLALRAGITDLFAVLDEERWPYATWLAKARYLLTVTHNDNDPAAAGAAVFELGLVPDFDLFLDLGQVRGRVGRNLGAVVTLSQANRPDRHRVLALGLTDRVFRARLAELVTQTGLADPRRWTRRIVLDRTNWPLEFSRWPLTERAHDEVRVEVTELDLPVAGEHPEHDTHPVLGEIAGQRYLPGGSNGRDQLAVRFRVEPDPRAVRGLARFTARLVAEDGGPTAAHASVSVGTTHRADYAVTLRKLRTAHLDPGWYFVRVLPTDAEGIELPLASAGPDDRGHESERFYLLTDGAEDDLPRPRVHREPSVAQALCRLWFDACGQGRDPAGIAPTAVTWATRRRPAQTAGHPGATRHTLRATFGGHGLAEIALSGVLVDAQRQILADPDGPVRWRLNLAGGPTDTDPDADHTAPGGPLVAEPGGRVAELPGPVAEVFRSARRRLFAAVRTEGGLVCEAHDLTGLREQVRDYAEAYAELVRWCLRRAEQRTGGPEQRVGADALAALAAVSALDTVTVRFRDQHDEVAHAVLVAPTHPLRLLWLVTWAELGRSWLPAAAELSPARIRSAQHSLLSGLAPLGFPLVVPRPDGRLTVAAGDLTWFWGVCLPTDVEAGGLLGALAGALGLPERAAVTPVVSGRELADRVERYLRGHPYVRTLRIAAVNPGRAEHLADMLVALQRRPPLRDIRYDLRLFLPHPDHPQAGSALAELLRGEWSNAEQAEAFAAPASGLTPKLAVARRPLAEFGASSGHTVHLTMLFDAFGAEQVDTAPAGPAITAPVHGLVQDVTTRYAADELTVAWHKQPRHGPATPLPGAEEFTDLLGALPELLSNAAGMLSTARAGSGQVPRITLSFDVAGRALLHQAHRSSDWVITVDRTMGVEYFDTPGSPQRPEYVIDHSPLGPAGFGHHMVISSRSVAELRALLAPAVEQHDLGVPARHAGTFFDQLRGLSGRLAFKLASAARTSRTEVVGLALARLYLDYQGALTDQILVPLDAHQDLYREARQRADAEDVADAVTLRRTDLALFDLDAEKRTITCRLVEVKCQSTLDISAYQSLTEQITGQIEASARVLGEHFDPDRARPDRPDRLVKNAELAALLGHYLHRAARHRMIRPAAAAEAQRLLDHLDAGYRWQTVRVGLIFDLAGSGCDQHTDGEVEFHRIGGDLARELLDAIPTGPAPVEPTDEPGPTPDGTLSTLHLDVPRPARAAYRAAERTSEPVPVPAVTEPGGRPGPAGIPGSAVTAGSGGTAPPGGEPAEVDRVEPADSVGEVIPGPDQPDQPDQPAPEPADEAADQPAAEPPAAPDQPPSAGTDRPADEPSPPVPVIVPDVVVGTDRPSPQYGILGEVAGRRIALDLNETHAISLFGVQGSGKSYTLGSIIEMACLPAAPVNQLPRPLATIVFHYSQTEDYPPEFTSMVDGNDDADQARRLRDRYGVDPRGLSDVLLLTPAGKLDQRRRQYPNILVRPLRFSSAELRAEHWRFLMGAVGNSATYLRELQRIMRAQRADLRLDTLRDAVADSALPDHLKQLAGHRLDLAAEYIDEGSRIGDLVRPGRMIVVDLRDEFIEKDDALGLFVVLMQIFAEATDTSADQARYNKLVVFDEAHKYIDSPELVARLVDSVREMRHKGLSVLVASQDPLSVPEKLITLSDHVILHRFTAPSWLRHLKNANTALGDLTPAKLAALGPGEAYLWSLRATDPAFSRGVVKITGRPRITRHGGGTRTAVS